MSLSATPTISPDNAPSAPSAEPQLHELVFEIHQERSEDLSDALLWAGAVSVAVEDANALTELEEPLFGEPGLEPKIPAWALNKVIASIADLTLLNEVLDEAAVLYGDALPDFALRLVPQLDWVRLTQSQFPPIEVSPRLWIVPSWHSAEHRANPAIPADALRLELDPGLAFGTGSHPTTHLCLQWLDAHPAALSHASVLDYGCGSGILGIAAEKLGAASVLGIDIDTHAVQSSRDNAAQNGCTRSTWGLPDAPISPVSHYGVVVANILTNPLKVLSPLLCSAVAQGGHLVLSGVLARQADEVLAIYRAYIPNMCVWQTHDGWVCLAGSKA
jgi:ribosomal protein L11 methyltransferase